MSTDYLLHAPAGGVVNWQVAAARHTLRQGETLTEVAIDTHADGTEVFTRTTVSREISTLLAQPQSGVLVETAGPLAITFDVSNYPRRTLHQRTARLFGLPLPRWTFAVQVDVESTNTPVTTIRTAVQITVLSMLRLRYVALLTTRTPS